MLVFHGGLKTIQVAKIMNGEYQIFDKVPACDVQLENGLNTFCYCNSDKTYESMIDLKEDVSEKLYENQYIFFFQYLNNSLDFCYYRGYYVLVADISEEILNQYMGVGKYGYGKCKIEYRVPGKIVIPNHVVEIVHCPTSKLMTELKEKYKSSYRCDDETEKAKKLMKQKQLSFVDYDRYLG